MIPVMCTLDPPSPEARVQFALAALAPGHRPESLFVGLRQFFHGHRFLATKAQAPRWLALSFPFRNGAIGRRPDRVLPIPLGRRSRRPRPSRPAPRVASAAPNLTPDQSDPRPVASGLKFDVLGDTGCPTTR